MVSDKVLLKRYGSPLDDVRTTNINEQTLWERKNMLLVEVPIKIINANSVIPKRIYANKDFAPVIIKWLEDLLENDLLKEINEWNGIFNVRLKRGLTTLSFHAYGCAVDVNAKNNPLGLNRQQCISKGLKPFSLKFLEISRKYFHCGVDFKSRPDGMHFQLKD